MSVPTPRELSAEVVPTPSVEFSVNDDVSLARAVALGDRQATSVVYHQFRRRIFGVAYRMVGASEAEEVAQETFIRLFRGIGSYRGDCRLSAWVYRLCVNTCLSAIAKQKKRRAVFIEDQEAVELHADVRSARGADEPWLAEQLQAALAALPPGYRSIVILHDVDGLSHEECAEILECSVGTSKSQLHKARMRLRQELSHLRGEGRSG